MRLIILLAALANAGGFLTFGEKVTHWAPGADGKLGIQGLSTQGQIDDYFAARGRVYRLHGLLDRVEELKPDLTALRETKVEAKVNPPVWVGAWDKGVLVLGDNEVIYLDGELKEAGRAALSPRKSGEITPALSLVDFAAFEGRGYLLGNTAEVFVLPLSKPKGGPLKAAVAVEYEVRTQGLWLDPEERTLNLLIESSEEGVGRADLPPGETLTVKRQKAFAYPLADLGKPRREAVLHERWERHKPLSIDDDPAQEYRHGPIPERLPPWTVESSSGVTVGIRSRTTPSYAEAFYESEGPVPPRRIVRLGTLGRMTPVEVRRDADDGPRYFEEKGRRLYLEGDLSERVLRLHPEPYAELSRQPELRAGYYKTLGY